MDRNLALELVRVTEAAALASARWMGKGDADAAYEAAKEAVVLVMKSVQISGKVVIGKSHRQIASSKAKTTTKSLHVDVVLDPLQSIRSVAFGWPNAMSVIAVSNKGGFFDPPVPFMNTIAVGPRAAGNIDISAPPVDNLVSIADAKRCYVEDLTVCVLERERNQDLIATVRESGARIQLIPDGEVAASLAASIPDSGVNVTMGIGGSTEALLSAAAIKCAGGDLQAQFHVRDEDDAEAIKRAGHTRENTVLNLEKMVNGEDTMFAATGVTGSEVLEGVQFKPGGAITHSIVMRNRSGTIRFIEANHQFDRKPTYK